MIYFYILSYFKKIVFFLYLVTRRAEELAISLQQNSDPNVKNFSNLSKKCEKRKKYIISYFFDHFVK